MGAAIERFPPATRPQAKASAAANGDTQPIAFDQSATFMGNRRGGRREVERRVHGCREVFGAAGAGSHLLQDAVLALSMKVGCQLAEGLQQPQVALLRRRRPAR